jgi:putative endonuclease
MKEHIYCTYIVASRSLNLYVGFTGDLLHRIRQHKEGAYQGYSKQYNCNRLLWYERHGDVHLAIAREKQLKGWSRNKKITLIKQQNPTWIVISAKSGVNQSS